VTPSQLSIQRRRQVFGAILITVAVVLLAVALLGHVRRMSYVAFAVAAVGVWMISRRGQR
jgi:asparagine N-glycosylation enzyme membrane subunit Stt3